MMLFKTIDGLLVGTKYLAWVIGLLGTIGSVILFLVNIPLGAGATAVFLATFLLSMAVTLLLLPKVMAKGILGGNMRYMTGLAACAAALVVMFCVWNVNGGFPSLNLIFV